MTALPNPWLEGATAIKEALKLESPEIQESIRRMDRKTYPEQGKAIREREEQQGNEASK